MDNRPGAGATIGTDIVAKAAPDGYTLGFFDNSFTINPGLVREKLPYNSLKEFTPLMLVATTPLVLAIHPSVPARTVPDLLDYARKNPGKVNYGSAGYGTGTHLIGEQLKIVTGLNIAHVSYKGAGPGITALLGGEIQMTFATSASIAQFVKAGRILGLATMAPTRSSLLPDVPSAKEAGMPAGVDLTVFWGWFAPAGTPENVLAALDKAFAANIKDPETQRQFREQSFDPSGMGRKEFGAFVRSEIGRWSEVISKAGIKPE